MHGSFFRFFHVELGYREAAQEVKEGLWSTTQGTHFRRHVGGMDKKQDVETDVRNRGHLGKKSC